MSKYAADDVLAEIAVSRKIDRYISQDRLAGRNIDRKIAYGLGST